MGGGNVFKKCAVYVGSWLLLLAVLIYPCFAILEANASPTYEYHTEYETQPRVYVTNYGEKYHNTSCHYLQSRIAKGLTEARNAGYTACSYCHGTPSGTIEVGHQVRVEIPPEPTSVWSAVGTAAAVSVIPALIIGYFVNAKLFPVREDDPLPDDEFDDTDD